MIVEAAYAGVASRTMPPLRSPGRGHCCSCHERRRARLHIVSGVAGLHALLQPVIAATATTRVSAAAAVAIIASGRAGRCRAAG